MRAVAIILLAAGKSSRLGRPKQLLPYGEDTLLRHAAQTGLDAALGPVIIVLGSAEEQCRASLEGMPVTVVSNARWDEGMGSSIAAGMQQVCEQEHRAVIIMLCDQPAITADILQSLEKHQRDTGLSIVAARHGEDRILGPPVLFTVKHFARLQQLRGHQGARSLFHHLPAGEVGYVSCPEAALDIDTEEDLVLLERR